MSRDWLLLSPPPSRTTIFRPCKSIINAESRPKRDPQFKHTAAHGFAIAEISGAHAGQAGVHRRLHSFVPKGIKPFVKRNQPAD